MARPRDEVEAVAGAEVDRPGSVDLDPERSLDDGVAFLLGVRVPVEDGSGPIREDGDLESLVFHRTAEPTLRELPVAGIPRLAAGALHPWNYAVRIRSPQ